MLIEKLRLGAKFHFAEEGVSYGEPANLVGPLLLPNADTNPEAYLVNPMGCTIDGRMRPKFIEETDTCFSNGRYVEKTDRKLVAMMIDISLRAQSEILHRLGWQVKNKITDGTAQTPFIGPDHVTGWAHIQLEADDALPRYTAAIWCDMRLQKDTEWSKDSTKPAITLTVDIANLLNSTLFNNIIGA